MQRSLSIFEADIEGFRIMKKKIMMESPSEVVFFLHIDCQPIKEVRVSSNHHFYG